jgi:sugar-specific transcriptional regulator TrmB
VTKPVEQTYVQNIQGYDPLLDHARDLISRAEKHLLVALWQPEASVLAEPIATAAARGVAVETLCFQACPRQCGYCRGEIHRYHLTPEDQARLLIVIQDQAAMVAGTAEQQSEAILTQQSTLIRIMTAYIRHSLALAAVLNDVGSGLEAELEPQTQDLLKSIGQGESWLEQMLRLLRS